MQIFKWISDSSVLFDLLIYGYCENGLYDYAEVNSYHREMVLFFCSSECVFHFFISWQFSVEMLLFFPLSENLTEEIKNNVNKVQKNELEFCSSLSVILKLF